MFLNVIMSIKQQIININGKNQNFVCIKQQIISINGKY